MRLGAIASVLPSTFVASIVGRDVDAKATFSKDVQTGLIIRLHRELDQPSIGNIVDLKYNQPSM